METAFEPIKLIVYIVNRNDGQLIEEICTRSGIYGHLMLRGRGTADNSTLTLLGLGETEKDIVFVTVARSRIDELMQKVSKKLELDKPGRGIAFSIPLSSVASQFNTYAAFAGKTDMPKDDKGENND